VRITSVDTFVMGVPGRNWIFVKIGTDEGIHGWGEATMEWHEGAVVEGIKRVTPLLLGQDPTRIERIWQTIFRHHWWRQSVSMSSALSGIDQALWDITGKVCGQPVYRLLGGAYHDRIRLYARNDRGLGSMAGEAEAAHEEGFTAFKGGVEQGEFFDEKAQIRKMIADCEAIGAALGSEFEIMLDLQGLFSFQSIAKLARGLSGQNIVWLEEPAPALTMDEMSRLVGANLGVRLALGERLCSRWAFKEVLEKHAADIIQPDICHAGGISELRRIAAYAEIFGTPVAPHNPLGPVAMAASVHTAAAMPNFLILEYCRRSPLFAEVQQEGVRIATGYAELPQRPGLGVELDEKVIARHPYQPMPDRLWVRPDGSIPMI
jgi:galactonate dehydratase